MAGLPASGGMADFDIKISDLEIEYLSILGITPDSSAALHRVKKTPAAIKKSAVRQFLQPTTID
jgi:hypothetical protein